MSWNPSLSGGGDESPPAVEPDAIETLIIPRARDIGGFEVRRALPSTQRQMVGPFIFFDQVGPAEFLDAGGIDVRPHPHIGLATITYLYQGEFEHRDSTGTHQMIYPGEVNWMIAGNGVTHSERTSSATRASRHSLFGIQTWVALPEQHEDDAAGFEHHKEAELPFLDAEGKAVRLIIGRAWGETAPVKTFSDMFYADAILQPGAMLPLPDDHEDRGIHVASGSIVVAGREFEAGQMMVFRPGDRISVTAGKQGARLVVLGGETLNGPRYIWWNFVASSQERIDAAKEAWAEKDWNSGRFRLPPGDTSEYIPLPRVLT